MKNSIVEILGNVTVLKPDQFYEYIAQSIKKKGKEIYCYRKSGNCYAGQEK